MKSKKKYLRIYKLKYIYMFYEISKEFIYSNLISKEKNYFDQNENKIYIISDY